MKRCPECRRDYYDDSLLYCLEDGSALLEGPTSSSSWTDEPVTAILHSTDASGEPPTRILPGSDTNIPSAAYAKRSRIIVGTICLVVIAAVGGGFYLYYGRGGSRQIDSIAVMPFVNESGNADVEYLSDGMTETLIRSLSQLPNLNVKARSSVFRYKGKDTDAKTIGNELGVQAILNGHVIQRGDQISLNLELIDAGTENVIWTDRYERRSSDLVSLQSEIARDVSQKLSSKLSGADQQKLAKNYTSSPEAYQLYLQGNFYWEKRTRDNVEIAIGFYQQAIEKDPNYALAYTGIAEAFAQPSQQPQGMPKARAAALKALSLDNDLAEAHSVLGRLLAQHDYDLSGAEREFRRALELNPNYAGGRCRYGNHLSILGRFEAAEAEIRRGLDLEPLSLICNVYYGNLMISARRYDDAVKHLKKTLELDENFWLTRRSLSFVYQIRGNYAESVEERARVAEINGSEKDAARMRETFEKHGWVGFMRFMVGSEKPTSRPRYDDAKYYAALGEKDKAFASLNQSFEDRQPYVPGIKVDPLLDPLRDDPRFQELLKKVGFPE